MKVTFPDGGISNAVGADPAGNPSLRCFDARVALGPDAQYQITVTTPMSQRVDEWLTAQRFL